MAVTDGMIKMLFSTVFLVWATWGSTAFERDVQGCYDKGEYGIWCPEGGDWYCKKNCKKEPEKELELDAEGCYDKGEYGIWCPKGGDWYCKKNCKKETEKKVGPDAEGCYDKGE